MGIRMDRNCRQSLVLSSLVFAVIASPAWAQTAQEPAPETEPRFSVSGTFGLFSDYRFRGVSLTGNDLAAQGSVSVTAPFGLSGGIWASNLDTASGDSLELDVFAAKSVDIKGTSLSIGGIGYLFPGNNGLNYGEATISAARSIGPLDVTIGGNYAWAQAGTGGRDNIYGFANAATPLGQIGPVALSAGAGLAYESGAFAFGVDKVDWNIRLTASVWGFDISAQYVDTNLPGASVRAGRAGAVFSISRSF